MTGPDIQAPNAHPIVMLIRDGKGMTSIDWMLFFGMIAELLWGATRSGPSSQRPSSTVRLRWPGMQYFDTTLGKPIWLKSIGPDAWVDANGAPV